MGRYEIKGELGRGGMAVVYRALDPQVKREVAVKILPIQYLDDPEFRTRFEREATTVASLEHPAIVPLYDFGEDASSRQLYFVMRLMTGGSLTERVRRSPLTIGEAARIFSRIAPGLDEAHSKGIVHRDLKPGNILFDQRGDPYISDFGIAKQAGGGTTVTSGIVGTPSYMSPEQARGEKELTGRSDIYSLGVILFEILTGTTPFQADTPIAVALKHITDPVPSIHQVRPDLPADCQTVLDRAMAKDPDQRFPNAVAFANALASIARGDPITLSTHRPDEQKATIRVGAVPTQKASARPTAQPQPTPRKETSWGGIVVGGLVLTLALVAVLAIGGVLVMPMLLTTPSSVPTATTDSAALALATKVAITHNAETQIASQLQATQQFGQQATADAQLTANAGVNSTQESGMNATSTAIALAQATIDTAQLATANAQATTTAIAAATAGAEATTQAQLGAVKVAFFKDNDVWIVNVDGSGLKQLTADGGAKSNLRWLPDGQTVAYISGRCVESVNFMTLATGRFGCFNSSTLLEGFEVSPDGQYFAISVDRITYVGDFAPSSLAPITNYSQLKPLSNCMIFNRSATQYLRWSADMTKMAIMVIGVSDSGLAADTIQLIKFECGNSNPISHDQFPGTRFSLPKFSELRKFQNFGWDGRDLFALIDYVRNDGFGNLYIYNTSTKRSPVQIDPLGGCCYRDPMWSADGQDFVFVWQDRSLGDVNKIELYYASYNSIISGGRLSPIPLPDGFFTDPQAKPQLVVSP
jgi:serine/threonine-protein kinase